MFVASSELSYCQGSVHDTGVVVEWARSVALFEELSSTSQVTSHSILK